MSVNIFKTVKDALAHLNPHDIRVQAEQPVRVRLFADSEKAFQQMEAYFVPAQLSHSRRAEIANVVQRASYSAAPGAYSDVEIYSPNLPVPASGFRFNLANPDYTVREIIKARPELMVALARRVYPFRAPVVDSVIKKISKENAWFSLATALPDIIPFISLPWAVGEFASDTAVLTANQIRLAFILAAASDREIGYREMKGEVGTILLGAIGWRALARELVGHIPFGGGLIPKAGIAYAGTRVAGLSLERYYRIGYGYSRNERDAAYAEALTRGKTIAGSLLNRIKQPQIA